MIFSGKCTHLSGRERGRGIFRCEFLPGMVGLETLNVGKTLDKEKDDSKCD